MMVERTSSKTFRQAGKPTIFSDLARLGLKATMARGAGSFSIDPFHLGNASAFHKLAGKPASPKGRALLVVARNNSGPTKVLATSAFRDFARRNALAAINSERFAGILSRHGYSCRVQLPAHRIVVEKN